MSMVRSGGGQKGKFRILGGGREKRKTLSQEEGGGGLKAFR